MMFIDVFSAFVVIFVIAWTLILHATHQLASFFETSTIGVFRSTRAPTSEGLVEVGRIDIGVVVVNGRRERFDQIGSDGGDGTRKEIVRTRREGGGGGLEVEGSHVVGGMFFRAAGWRVL